MEIGYFYFKYAQKLLAMKQTTEKMVKWTDTDIIMVFTIKMKKPCGGLAIYPRFYSVSCPVMGYKVWWCSLFRMQLRAIGGFSFKHTLIVPTAK